MKNRLALFLFGALLLLVTPASAQNTICPTAAVGTSNNQCASTAFVQNQFAVGVPITIGTTVINNGTPGYVLYDNSGIVGEYAITGTGPAVLGTAPTIASPAFTGTVTGNNTIPLGILAQSAANTMLGNWSGSTANVLANAMPSCADTGGNHLNYVSGTGITCGTGLGNGITALTGDVTATGPGSAAATLATAQPGAHTWALGQTFSSAITYGGVTLSNAATGTGKMVLDTAPTVSALTVTGSFAATGLVTNADLANPATTVNGQTCTLGSACTVTAAATAVTVGSTTIGSGTTTRILYDNAGTLGEYTITGTGTVVAMQASPTFSGTVGGSNILPLTGVAQIGANTVLSNWTAGSANVVANTWPACANDGSHALVYVNGSGLACATLSSGGTVTSIVASTGLTGGTITTTGTIAVDIASGTNFEAGTANKILDGAGVFTTETTTTFSTTPTFDFSTFFNTKITLTNNISSITCSNQKAAQSGTIRFIQDGTGSRTLPGTFGCNFKFAGGTQPVLTTTAGAIDAMVYSCSATNYCVASLMKNVQ